MKTVVDHNGARRADLAAIHVAKKALGWDDDTYRDIMFTVCRVRSAGDLDFAGRKIFLAHLRACQKQTAGDAQAKAVKAVWGPKLRLLWALWQQLADAGLVKERGRPALVAWVSRQTGVDRLEWLTTPQLDMVLHSAKAWLVRKGES